MNRGVGGARTDPTPGPGCQDGRCPPPTDTPRPRPPPAAVQRPGGPTAGPARPGGPVAGPERGLPPARTPRGCAPARARPPRARFGSLVKGGTKDVFFWPFSSSSPDRQKNGTGGALLFAGSRGPVGHPGPRPTWSTPHRRTRPHKKLAHYGHIASNTGRPNRARTTRPVGGVGGLGGPLGACGPPRPRKIFPLSPTPSRRASRPRHKGKNVAGRCRALHCGTAAEVPTHNLRDLRGLRAAPCRCRPRRRAPRRARRRPPRPPAWARGPGGGGGSCP